MLRRRSGEAFRLFGDQNRPKATKFDHNFQKVLLMLKELTAKMHRKTGKSNFTFFGGHPGRFLRSLRWLFRGFWLEAQGGQGDPGRGAELIGLVGMEEMDELRVGDAGQTVADVLIADERRNGANIGCFSRPVGLEVGLVVVPIGFLDLLVVSAPMGVDTTEDGIVVVRAEGASRTNWNQIAIKIAVLVAVYVDVVVFGIIVCGLAGGGCIGGRLVRGRRVAGFGAGDGRGCGFGGVDVGVCGPGFVLLQD